MVGRIIKKQKSTSHIEYLFFSNLSDRHLAPLWKNDEYALFCDCNASEKIELKVGKRQDTYYLYNAKQGFTDSHHPRCRKFLHYMGKSDYEAGWKDEDGVFTATLCDDVFALGEKENLVAAPSPHSSDGRAKSCVNPTTQKGEVTLLGFVTKLNLITWERCAKNGSLPESMRKFLEKVYGTMKTIKLTNKRIDSLQAINYEYKKTGAMEPKKSFLFVYMRFVKVTENPYQSQSVKVHCQNTFGKEVYFFVAKATFRKAYENVRFEKKEQQTIVVGGFVYKTSLKSSLLTFSSICMFVTNMLGLYSESSYELEAYDNLCDAKRVFYKPYYPLPEYGDKKPDILFLDTKQPVIGEIFGFNSQDYLEERTRKLQIAQELQESYGFWKWDAYEDESLPAFPAVHRPPGRAAPPDPRVLAYREVAASSVRLETTLQTSPEETIQQTSTTLQLAQERRVDTLQQTSAQAVSSTQQQPSIQMQSAQTQRAPSPPVSNRELLKQVETIEQNKVIYQQILTSACHYGLDACEQNFINRQIQRCDARVEHINDQYSSHMQRINAYRGTSAYSSPVRTLSQEELDKAATLVRRYLRERQLSETNLKQPEQC